MTAPPKSRTIPILVEAVVIVTSILLAFGLEAWWEARRQQDDLAEVLQLLDADLERNSALLRSSIDAHRAINASVERLTERGTHEGGDSPFIPAEVFDPITGGLDALMVSGSLGRIANVELRALIASLPGRLADLAEKEARALERREVARNRVAELGVRLGDMPTGPNGEPTTSDVPSDHPYFTDTELLNLAVMRGVEEREAIASGEALLEHMLAIREGLPARLR